MEAGCAGNSSPHNETDNGCSSESCTKGSPKEAAAVLPDEREAVDLYPRLVARACPIITDFTPDGEVSAETLVVLGQDLRGSIGAHPSAWTEAVGELGRMRAALLVLIVAQLHADDADRGETRIRNSGGYFRQLVRLCAEGRYDIPAELMSMRRRRMT